MLKKLLNGLAVALLLLPLNARAVGLGQIEVRSALSEQMDATIGIVGAKPGDGPSLRVGMASAEAYKKASIDRGFHLTNLKFSIEEDPVTEIPFVQVRSQKSIREPLLNFLVELASPDGTLLKEYTVFLDPPTSLVGVAPALSQPVALPLATTPPAEATPAAGATSAVGIDEPATEKDSYGPTRDGDTLWKIAMRYAGSAADMDRLMLAVVKANPEAFVDGNANRMSSGVVLRIPTMDEIQAIEPKIADAEIRRQHKSWAENRSAVVIETKPAPATTSGAVDREVAAKDKSAEQQTESSVDAPTDSRVRLLRADELGAKEGAHEEGAGKAKTAESMPGTATSNDVLLLEEQLDAKREENDELRGRIAELEDRIATMNRMLELQKSAADATATATDAVPAEPAVGQPAEQTEVPVEPRQPDAEVDDLLTEAVAEVQSAKAGEAPAETAPTEIVPPEPEKTQAQPTPATTEPKPASAAVVTSLEPGVLDLVIGNLPVIVGVLLALVVITLGWRFARRSRQAKEEEAFTEEVSGAEDATAIRSVAGLTEVPKFEAPQVPRGGAAVAASPRDDDATSFLDDFISPTAGSAVEPEIEDVDPIAEADVYLAYGRHQQAEEILQEAIQFAPERLELRLKLLEIFHAQGKAAEFDEFAAAIQGRVGGDENTWNKIKAMGHKLNPANPLYTGAAEIVGDLSLVVSSAAQDQEVLDLDESSASSGTAELDGFVGSLNLDDLGDDQAVGNLGDETFFDIGSDAEAVGKPSSSTISVSEATGPDAVVEMSDNLDEGFPELQSQSTVQFEVSSNAAERDVQATVNAAADDEMGLDFNLDDLDAGGSPGVDEPIRMDEGMTLEFDIGESKTGSGLAADDDEGLDATVISGLSFDADMTSDSETMQSIDAVASKLDLLAAFVEMGDREGAEGVMNEIRAQGSDEQIGQAEVLLAQLD